MRRAGGGRWWWVGLGDVKMEHSLIHWPATMPESTDEIPDNPISLATPDEAALLADLYAKLFMATGFPELVQHERREELVEWITPFCSEGKLCVIRDSHGPITLGHYDPVEKEVVAIVTRDGMEGKGYGAKMLNYFANLEPLIRISPVTDAGLRLARKCGFSKGQGSERTWILGNDSNE